MIPRPFLRSCAAALALAAAGCAAPPVVPGDVVVMKAGALPPDPGLPPPGTTWRLEERELLALSPAPYVPPPPAPIPAPRPPEVIVPYAVPYPYYGWGVPYYGPTFGFSLGYTHGRHTHRHPRRR